MAHLYLADLAYISPISRLYLPISRLYLADLLQQRRRQVLHAHLLGEIREIQARYREINRGDTEAGPPCAPAWGRGGTQGSGVWGRGLGVGVGGRVGVGC